MGLESDHHGHLVRSLQNVEVWPHEIEQVEVIETHISSVFLVGDYAYKLKKPLDLGFLDFSTLERRRFCCEEEVRLNRRLAPDVYLEAVPVRGTVAQPRLSGPGDPVDWLVKMRRFDAHAVFSEHPEYLNEGLVTQLALQVADFHQLAQAVDQAGPYGTPEAVMAPMAENFSQLRAHIDEKAIVEKLAPLEAWTRQRFEGLKPRLLDRRRQGHVRECHGDLHLGNIVLEQGRPLIFDGIEFAPELRWIDTISDLAFLLMDLHHRQRSDLANMVLNSYLEKSGDYSALPLLAFYMVYRAMVRAKVTSIRMGQPGLDAGEYRGVHDECLEYLTLAESFTHSNATALIITHGVSGSGKSTVSGGLIPLLPLVRIRSDIERKRLAGIATTDRVDEAGQEVLYSREMTERTYHHMQTCARAALEAGFIVLLDAAFLKRSEREEAATLAGSMASPFLILDFDVEESELIRRIEERMQRNDDASDADVSVLRMQLCFREPLTGGERTCVLDATGSLQGLKERIERSLLE